MKNKLLSLLLVLCLLGALALPVFAQETESIADENACNAKSDAYVTYMDYAYEADTYFPNLDKMDDWKIVEESEEQTYFNIEYYYRTYKKVE